MSSFVGFPAGKTRVTPVPDQFIVELLPDIDDLAELKLTLFMFWSLHRQRGYPRYLSLPELEGEGLLLTALSGMGNAEPLQSLHCAIEAAVARGTLLRITIAHEEAPVDYLFLNTPQGRKAVEEIRAGDLMLERVGVVREPHIVREQPRIVELYEQNIGLLQPLLVEELLEAERDYPTEWIEDAFRLAVERNARNWRYIRAILERWARDGKDDGQGRSANGQGRCSTWQLR